MTAESAASGMLSLLADLFSVLHADVYTDNPSVPQFQYGGLFLLKAVQAIQEKDVTAVGSHDELQQCRQSGAECTTDIIAWWGVSAIYIYIYICTLYLSNGSPRLTPDTLH